MMSNSILNFVTNMGYTTENNIRSCDINKLHQLKLDAYLLIYIYIGKIALLKLF